MKAIIAISSLFRKTVQGLFLSLLFIYKYTLSPILHIIAPGGGCRFYPTCSEYATEAIRLHGPVRGSWLALKRLAKCHPWGPHGVDPVPSSCSCTSHTDHQHPNPFTPSHAGPHTRVQAKPKP